MAPTDMTPEGWLTRMEASLRLFEHGLRELRRLYVDDDEPLGLGGALKGWRQQDEDELLGLRARVAELAAERNQVLKELAGVTEARDLFRANVAKLEQQLAGTKGGRP